MSGFRYCIRRTLFTFANMLDIISVKSENGKTRGEIILQKKQCGGLVQRGSWLTRAKRSVGRYWQLYLLILPALIYLWIFNYQPMYGVQIAFRKFSARKGIAGSPWVGLYYFEKFLTYPDFGKIVFNTLRITLLSLMTFPLSIILALSINEVRSNKFKKTVQMITYAPHFISTVVVCSMISLFLDRGNGLINHILAMLGHERVAFMGIPEAFPIIYVISGVWQHIGWDSIIYISALSGVSPELVEAARIDGASRLQIMWHINFKCILPTIMIMLIMRCGSIMSLGFEKVYLLQNSLNLEASQVISTYVYELGLLNGEMSYSAAINLFNTVINILLLLIVNTIVKKGSEISLF